jgi:hypothetical protein
VVITGKFRQLPLRGVSHLSMEAARRAGADETVLGQLSECLGYDVLSDAKARRGAAGA